MLDQLLADASTPKIKPGDFQNLIKLLKKLTNDTNPAVQ